MGKKESSKIFLANITKVNILVKVKNSYKDIRIILELSEKNRQKKHE